MQSALAAMFSKSMSQNHSSKSSIMEFLSVFKIGSLVCNFPHYSYPKYLDTYLLLISVCAFIYLGFNIAFNTLYRSYHDG